MTVALRSLSSLCRCWCPFTNLIMTYILSILFASQLSLFTGLLFRQSHRVETLMDKHTFGCKPQLTCAS